MSTDFEDIYLKVRESEKRLYSDEQVATLPDIDNKHVHAKEWQVRKSSFGQLKKYLLRKNKQLRILDLGCGNGWMSNRLTEINNSTVTGTDLNSLEIAQAKRVFEGNKQVSFGYGNIFDQNFLTEQFDIIVLAASIQYFSDVPFLIKRLFELLKPGGEIHIIDSHFYNSRNRIQSIAASRDYYSSLGFIEMADQYHHHLWDELKDFDYEITNRSFANRVMRKIFRTKKDYFPWVIIKKSPLK